jgi:hypothetical protein
MATCELNKKCYIHNGLSIVFPLPQNDCPVYLPNYIFEAPSQIFSRQTFIIKKSFDAAPSGGGFIVVVVFYLKSHTYNYSVNGQHVLILPKLGTRTIVLGQKEYSCILGCQEE